MTSILGIIVRVYRLLLRLYPSSFRREFEEEMLLDFSDMAVDADGKDRFSLALFCLRELVDFPVNLLRTHLKEGNMVRILRSQPINYGLGGAIGFGLAFASSSISFVILSFASESIFGQLSVFYFDLFQTEHGLELFYWIPSALGSLLTGLFLGILVAVFFAERSNYPRYILVGMLMWFLHDAIGDVLFRSFNWVFYLGSRHSTYLNIATSVLSGAFLGSIFVFAKSQKRGLIRWLIAGALAYPLIAYFYVKLLFNLFIITTPWLFIALMILMAIYIGSVLIFAIKSGGAPKNLWMIIITGIGYPLLAYVGSFLAALIYSPTLPMTIYPGGVGFWPLVLSIALSQAAYGICFGLLLGLLWGFHKKRIAFESAIHP